MTQSSGLALLSLAGPVRLGRDILRPHKLDVQSVAAGRYIHRIGREAQHVPTSGELEQRARRFGFWDLKLWASIGHLSRWFRQRRRIRCGNIHEVSRQQSPIFKRFEPQTAGAGSSI